MIFKKKWFIIARCFFVGVAFWLRCLLENEGNDMCCRRNWQVWCDWKIEAAKRNVCVKIECIIIFDIPLTTIWNPHEMTSSYTNTQKTISNEIKSSKKQKTEFVERQRLIQSSRCCVKVHIAKRARRTWRRRREKCFVTDIFILGIQITLLFISSLLHLIFIYMSV